MGLQRQFMSWFSTAYLIGPRRAAAWTRCMHSSSPSPGSAGKVHASPLAARQHRPAAALACSFSTSAAQAAVPAVTATQEATQQPKPHCGTELEWQLRQLRPVVRHRQQCVVPSDSAMPAPTSLRGAAGNSAQVPATSSGLCSNSMLVQDRLAMEVARGSSSSRQHTSSYPQEVPCNQGAKQSTGTPAQACPPQADSSSCPTTTTSSSYTRQAASYLYKGSSTTNSTGAHSSKDSSNSDSSSKPPDSNGSNNADSKRPTGSDTSSTSSSSSTRPQQPASPLAEALGSQLAQAAAKRLTPRAIVAALDQHIVGQQAAKRAVAVALRNRWRRHQLAPEARNEVAPKNILMAGPTGCGKTEIARRLAKLVDAPFIKVEATKFTELGYVGRDVEDIIKDLVDASMAVTRARLKEALAEHVQATVEEVLLTALLGPHGHTGTREAFRDMLRKGQFDSQPVMVPSSVLHESLNSPEAAMQRVLEQMRGGRPSGAPPGTPKGSTHVPVSEARKLIQDSEAEKLLSSDLVSKEALRAAAEDGIVFIDEIDKIVDSQRGMVSTGANVSNEGVQRDLLPILEGCQVSTKLGTISTDHILFICSGAFHSSKPSDMLAELQGRLPIRVELAALTRQDFHRILTEPQYNMIQQQQMLLATEGVDLRFTDEAIQAIARVAEEANRLLDNIGARRLHTVLERVLSDISFSAPEKVAAARKAGQEGMLVYEIDAPRVEAAVADLLSHHDLSKYML